MDISRRTTPLSALAVAVLLFAGQAFADSAAVVPERSDFQRGSLQVISYARPGKLFTASGDLV